MRIALCETGTITPERDAGSRAVADLFSVLKDLGHEVDMFVEAEQHLPQRVAAFAPDVIVISRPGLFARLHPLLHPIGARIIYFAMDLHYVRVRLQTQLQGSTHNPSRVLRLIEEQCFLKADLSLVPTAEEVTIVEAEFPGAAVRAVNYFVMPEHPLPAGPPASFRAAFVGGPLHEPNLDGIRWFLARVWPSVAGGELVVCGAWEHEAPQFANVRGVRFTGALSDAELDETLAAASVGIAPLRFGAGMKRKTLHYLSLGLPVVGTEFAVEGLVDDAGHTPGVTIATTPEEWLAAFESLSDPDFWRTQSLAGWSFVRERFSASRYRELLSSAMNELQ